MQCCGKTRRTRFCADCGSELKAPDPAQELLAHCHKQKKDNEKTVESLRTLAVTFEKGGHSDSAKYHLERAERRELVVDKWEQWINRLTQLLELEGKTK